MSVMWLVSPIAVVQGIYAKYFGVSLATIAGAILIAKLVDAISDPIVGILSDRFYQKHGTRKPYILVGGLLFIVCSYYFFVPPPQATGAYFLLWYVAFYFTYTIFEIPHLAWGGDLAPTSREKTAIFTWRSMANYSGWMLFYAIPLLPFFDSSVITPKTLSVSVILAGVLGILMLFTCLKYTPNQVLRFSGISPERPKKNCSLREDGVSNTKNMIASMKKNKAFWIFVAAYGLGVSANGMWFSLIFIYVDIYLGLGEQFAKMYLIAFTAGLAMTPLWGKIAIRIGNRASWSFAALFVIVSFIYTGMLSPGESGLSELITLKIIQTVGYACMGVVCPAIVSEIADYGELKSNDQSSATYFAAYNFITKLGIAIASASALAIAGWYGFDASSTEHSEESVQGLILAISWLPVVLACLSLFLIFLIPINSRRHAIIRRRLDLVSSHPQR